MPSVTTWMRVEPKNRSRTLPGLAARVHDPLWMLGRQWQLGEWDGEDAASPVSATLETEEAPLSTYIPTAVASGINATAVPFPTEEPLEMVVEAEAVAPVQSTTELDMAVWMSACAGLDFLALLAADEANAWSSRFPLRKPGSADLDAWPSEHIAVWRLLAQESVPDGRAIYEALRPGSGTGALPPAPSRPLLEVWQGAYRPFFEPRASEAWNPERLKYEFGVSAHLSSGEVVLAASDYDGRRLDWWSFDIERATTTAPTPPRRRATATPMRIPVPVTFPGMPVTRFWEFEDAKVNLASVDAERTDLARLLFLEFALAFGNDFFLIPHALPVGSLCRTSALVVSDTFGERTSISPADATWTMFQLSGRTAAENLLFLPPVLPKHLESPALEEVRFARDEMANIVWALERLVTSPLDKPVRRMELYNETHPRDGAPPVAPPPDGSLRYRLATDVPDYWLPFVPVTESGGLFFKRDGLVLPMGRLIASSIRLREEEVPREGVEISRCFQLARWIGGSTSLWIGRKRGVGTGEASSGLRFDQAEK